MSRKTNTGLKGLRLFFIIPGILIIFGLTSYLAFNQFILKPIAAEEERAYQLSKENRKLSKEYEDRQSILMQLVNAKRSRLLAMNTLEAAAGNIPEELSLRFINSVEVRGEGNNITLNGEVKSGQGKRVDDYRNNLARIMVPDPVSKKQRKLFHDVVTTDSRDGIAGTEGPGRWTIVCMIRPDAVNASNLILPEAPEPVNYKWEMEERSPLKIFLDGKKRLKSVAAKLQKEKEAYNQIFTSIQTNEAGGKSTPSGSLPFAGDARQAQTLMLEGIRRNAQRAGITITRSVLARSGTRKDNPFEEHKRNVSFECDPEDLMDFFRGINQETAAVRVSNMKISPTADRQRLQVQLSLSVHILKPNAGVNGFEAIGQLLFGMNNNEEQNKVIHQYLDNASQTFTKSDAFRLIPPPKIEKPAKIVEFVPVAVPQLAGLLRINGRTKALFRMLPTRGGKAQYVQLAVGESRDGVEVISVDVATSTVMVKVGKNTYDFKIEKPKLASKPASERGSSGSRPSRTSGSRPGGSRPSTAPGKTEGLKSVPRRPDN